MYSSKNTGKTSFFSFLLNASPRAFAWWLVVFGVAVINFGIYNGESSVESYQELRTSQQELSQVVNRLKSENEVLQTEISKLKNSPSYAEKVLRDKYHVTGPNEEIIFFVD